MHKDSKQNKSQAEQHFETALEMEEIVKHLPIGDPARNHYRQNIEYFLNEATIAEKEGF